MLSFNTKELRDFFSNPTAGGAPVEAALLHMIFVDLIGSLRRHRKGVRKLQSKVTIADVMSEELDELREMLEAACSSESISPPERRRIREYKEKHGIDDTQFRALLKEIDWTEAEWKDGAKCDKTGGRPQNRDPS